VSRRQLGAGYTALTPASLQAVALLAGEGVGLEPVYGGKAFAGLLAELPKGATVLYWHTARRGPLPIATDWKEHLPAELRRRLEAGEGPSRRWLVATGAAAIGVGVLGARTSGYGRYPGWEGNVLRAWEAEVLRAVAEAVLPPAPLTEAQLDALPARTDAFLVAMSPESRLEVHGLFALVEQATGLDGALSRFTRLAPAERLAFLARLESLGDLPAVAAREIGRAHV
jgi:D-cysteine desulfhydrase